MIVPIRLRISNAYLIVGRRAVLVDSGCDGEAGRIIKAMAAAGVAPADLSMIIHTHAHADHCGSTWALSRMCEAPVAVHQADAAMLQSGLMRPVILTRPLARLIGLFGAKRFDGVRADLVIEREIDLRPYGIEGRLLHTPGHTHGSVSILLDGGEAIVGDLMIGGFLRRHQPQRCWFAEEPDIVPESIAGLMRLEPSIIHPGHGGPLSPQAVRERLVGGKNFT